MTHVFVSPHPDDAALSCGGLIARLRDRGEAVAILSVFCGPGSLPTLTPFQLVALGFGGDARPGSGANLADADMPGDAPTPEQAMSVRRAEDESFAHLVGASIAFVRLPDAVFRDYEGDGELMGPPRPDDPAPVEELRAALERLTGPSGALPDTLYLPLSVGGHVDHRQTRRAAMALLSEPGSPHVERARFYEDFPYSLTVGFERLDQLDSEIVASLPAGTRLEPEYVEIGDLIDRKIDNLHAYASQLGRLFGEGSGGGGTSGVGPLEAAVRARAARLGELGGVGPAERYWRVAS